MSIRRDLWMDDDGAPLSTEVRTNREILGDTIIHLKQILKGTGEVTELSDGSLRLIGETKQEKFVREWREQL